ncbi:tRNA-splicing endonuclease subunit Sen54 [Phlebotomus argentipes]|uniref:tRNA-splicing endonuclease subunit Sen54 n=1 Tax=Phlebotomus argentipes TaxID=94469 RepID=UPI0028930EEE|nr:tRNA-splicing endonuclease subunit Sen54 [Phlebotomus argentipes]
MQSPQEIQLLGSLASAEELVRKSNETIASFCTGSKKNFPDGSSAEFQKLGELYSNLRDILSQERIGTENNRLVGEYNSSTRKILLRKIFGSIQYFGHANEQNETFLEPHEALYLLEMNRLIIYYNSVIVSLEQAYEIFLHAQEDCLTLEEYFVYSSLNKLGYIVRKFNPNIIYSIGIECPRGSPKGKRKITEDEPSSSKKFKADEPSTSYSGESTVNDLINLSPEMEFESVFESFNVIKLTPGKDNLAKQTLKFSFDLYNPTKIYKKSQPPAPDYRILVLRSDQNCPERDDLMQLYNSCETKGPIIVVYLDNNLKMSGFLYKFA